MSVVSKTTYCHILRLLVRRAEIKLLIPIRTIEQWKYLETLTRYGTYSHIINSQQKITFIKRPPWNIKYFYMYLDRIFQDDNTLSKTVS